MEVERLQQITLPALSFKDRAVAYIRCIGKMCCSDRVDSKDDGRKAATVMRVINLEDGLQYRLICPALLVSAFADEGFEYVGKCFEVQVSPNKKPGKDYKEVEVFEIKCQHVVDGVDVEVAIEQDTDETSG